MLLTQDGSSPDLPTAPVPLSELSTSGVVVKSEPVKRHECHFCGKRFPTPSKLQRHALVHTGEKPFSCDVCLKGFTQLAHLKNHKKYSHGISEQGQPGAAAASAAPEGVLMAHAAIPEEEEGLE